MKVLGPIVNGDNMMIGANAVMIKDAPFGSVQGGAYEMSRSGTEGGRRLSVLSVSYTHLDVYKRQPLLHGARD